jgi:hypothetical protein
MSRITTRRQGEILRPSTANISLKHQSILCTVQHVVRIKIEKMIQARSGPKHIVFFLCLFTITTVLSLILALWTASQHRPDMMKTVSPSNIFSTNPILLEKPTRAYWIAVARSGWVSVRG